MEVLICPIAGEEAVLTRPAGDGQPTKGQEYLTCSGLLEYSKGGYLQSRGLKDGDKPENEYTRTLVYMGQARYYTPSKVAVITPP